MDDLISRKAAIEALGERPLVWEEYTNEYELGQRDQYCSDRAAIETVPSTQPKTSRIENALHGKSAEEQYDFLWWLMQDYGMQFTDTRVAVIEWLKGRKKTND